MSLQEKLETKVEEYNELITQIDEVRKNLEAGEQERLMRLGQIQQLEELLKEEQAEILKSLSQNQEEEPDSDDEA